MPLVRNAGLSCDSVFCFLRIIELSHLPCGPFLRFTELWRFFAAPSRRLGRGLKILFLWPGSEALRFSYILISKLAISGSWSSRGLFGLLRATSAGALLGLLLVGLVVVGQARGCWSGWWFGVRWALVGFGWLGVPWLIEVGGFTLLVL